MGINKSCNVHLLTNPYDIVEFSCCDSPNEECVLKDSEMCDVLVEFNKSNDND